MIKHISFSISVVCLKLSKKSGDDGRGALLSVAELCSEGGKESTSAERYRWDGNETVEENGNEENGDAKVVKVPQDKSRKGLRAERDSEGP